VNYYAKRVIKYKNTIVKGELKYKKRKEFRTSTRKKEWMEAGGNNPMNGELILKKLQNVENVKKSVFGKGYKEEKELVSILGTNSRI